MTTARTVPADRTAAKPIMVGHQRRVPDHQAGRHGWQAHAEVRDDEEDREHTGA
ncbi:hypothetical protein [Actinacidiphila glaucinigra]|uniref:hypothetical protein n=1 Tax=Actinacidiphila glaucinigra TaxID=235986 RepID=UPI003D938E59